MLQVLLASKSVYIAVEMGHMDAVDAFISAGCDSDRDDNHGMTSLTLAGFKGHTAEVESLQHVPQGDGL